MVTNILTVDVGGSAIKYGLFNQQSGQLTQKGAVVTPENLEAYYDTLDGLVRRFKKDFQIVGVAMSSPGAVNKATGVIEGASALPYIHHFNIHQELEKRFDLPLSIENDANCAALAEVNFGAARGLYNVLFIVLGTGVGGAVVIDGKVHHGKHLFGGEFGFMLMDNRHSFSEYGTVVNMARRYNEKTGSNLNGFQVCELALSGDKLAKREFNRMTYNMAKGIFNLTYSFDPELVIIGGGVSQADWLIPEIQKQMKKIMKIIDIAPFEPEIATCQFHNDANLIGAAVDFAQTFKK